ncbi:ThiJ/PfpI family protein (plasmid) [Rhizobium favelukesii]|uniref:ThiJ/PfpI family protein n=1 Tax=Rhizobium favelukesii TaxID=348824 RepID=W6RID9_9HYPH|nr:ThiJ/PfpI family protein [Rhizobium favelukesii]
MALLSTTAHPNDINPADYDAIYFTDGHAFMWDFPDDEGLQRITRVIWEKGGIVSSVQDRRQLPFLRSGGPVVQLAVVVPASNAPS